jgi:hypothetical protein
VSPGPMQPIHPDVILRFVKLATLERALEDARGVLSGLEPERLAASDAARLFSLFGALEKTGAAGVALLAGRASHSGAWKENGHRDPASWVADQTGSTLGEAISVLETAGRLEVLPDTADALRSGELTGRQAREIAGAAAVDPGAEKSLLELAGKRGLKGLRDECRRVKHHGRSEDDARARYEAIRRNRFFRSWTELDGAGRLEARLTPDDFARVQAAIKEEANLVFASARRAGTKESSSAYEADALVSLVTGAAKKSKASKGGGQPSTLMHLRVDLAALRRGKLNEGEVCEIPGVGPVPLARATSELGDALLKVVVTDGVDVRSVCHVGRTVPGHIRSALEERDRHCVVPGCDIERGLEIDHFKVPFAEGGPTELWNLARLCKWHHYLKTHCGYALEGEPSQWEWRAPPSAERNPILTA